MIFELVQWGAIYGYSPYIFCEWGWAFNRISVDQAGYGIDLLVTSEHDGDELKIAKALGFELEEVKEEIKKSEAKAKKMKKK